MRELIFKADAVEDLCEAFTRLADGREEIEAFVMRFISDGASARMSDLEAEPDGRQL